MRALLTCVCLLTFTAAARGDAPIDLNGFLGRVVYLDFWASWCAPCKQSFPWMQNMKKVYEQRGLSIVAVNLDQDRHDAEKFLAKYQPNFEIRFDPHGKLAEQFDVQGMPTSVVIDRHGARRFTHIGFRPVDAAAYEDQLRQLLEER